MKNTDELLNEIKNTKNILDYIERNKQDMQLNTLTECLNN